MDSIWNTPNKKNLSAFDIFSAKYCSCYLNYTFYHQFINWDKIIFLLIVYIHFKCILLLPWWLGMICLQDVGNFQCICYSLQIYTISCSFDDLLQNVSLLRIYELILNYEHFQVVLLDIAKPTLILQCHWLYWIESHVWNVIKRRDDVFSSDLTTDVIYCTLNLI